MFFINYDDLDASLNYILSDYISENKLLDPMEQDQLLKLKNNNSRIHTPDKRTQTKRIKKLMIF